MQLCWVEKVWYYHRVSFTYCPFLKTNRKLDVTSCGLKVKKCLIKLLLFPPPPMYFSASTGLAFITKITFHSIDIYDAKVSLCIDVGEGVGLFVERTIPCFGKLQQKHTSTI